MSAEWTLEGNGYRTVVTSEGNTTTYVVLPAIDPELQRLIEEGVDRHSATYMALGHPQRVEDPAPGYDFIKRGQVR